MLYARILQRVSLIIAVGDLERRLGPGPSTRGSNGDSLLHVVSPGGGGNADDGFKTGDRYSLADTQAHEDICGRRRGRT